MELRIFVHLIVLVIIKCLDFQAAEEEIDKCWSRFGDYQYMLMTSHGPANFRDAKATCKKHNASFASVHSQSEDEFLMDLIMLHIGLPTWIGLRWNRNHFEWADKSEVTYIHPEYVPDSANERCIYIYQEWLDGNCEHSTLYFICKRQVEDGNACYDEPTSTETVSSLTALDANGISTEVTITEQTFTELLEEMTVKKKPVYKLKEGEKSKTIGVIAILILSFIVLGIIFLDLPTLWKHLKFLMKNTKGLWGLCGDYYWRQTRMTRIVSIEPTTPSDVVLEIS